MPSSDFQQQYQQLPDQQQQQQPDPMIGENDDDEDASFAANSNNSLLSGGDNGDDDFPELGEDGLYHIATEAEYKNFLERNKENSILLTFSVPSWQPCQELYSEFQEMVRDNKNILWAEFDVNDNNHEFVRFMGSLLAPISVQLYERDGILTDTFVDCGPSKARELKRKLDKLLVLKKDHQTSRVKATSSALWNPSPRALRGLGTAYSQDTISGSSTATLAPAPTRAHQQQSQQPPTEFYFVQEGVIFLFFVILALLFSGELRKKQRKKESKERKKLLRKKLHGVGVDKVEDENDDDNSIDTVDQEAIEEADKFIMLNNFKAYGFF